MNELLFKTGIGTYTEFMGYTYESQYPYCSEHGAMNMVSKFGLWRCLMCHIGYDEQTDKFLPSSLDGFKHDAPNQPPPH